MAQQSSWTARARRRTQRRRRAAPRGPKVVQRLRSCGSAPRSHSGGRWRRTCCGRWPRLGRRPLPHSALTRPAQWARGPGEGGVMRCVSAPKSAQGAPTKARTARATSIASSAPGTRSNTEGGASWFQHVIDSVAPATWKARWVSPSAVSAGGASLTPRTQAPCARRSYCFPTSRRPRNMVLCVPSSARNELGGAAQAAPATAAARTVRRHRVRPHVVPGAGRTL